ncbi:MAG: Gldg family protein [Verrucomicrobiales bacterium]
MSDEKSEQPKPSKQGGAEIRRVNIIVHVVAQIALATLLFMLVNFLSYRHYGRKDLTDDQRYSVDDDTVRFLKTLDQDVMITMAFAKGSRIYPQLSALLDEYAELSGGRVKVDKFDPGRDKARALEFRERMSMPIDGNMLVLDFGGRQKTVTEAEMLADDGRLFFGEDVITSRIIGATQEGDQKVYFLGSYGGVKSVAGESSFDRLRELAALQFASVETLNLADVDEIPYDADAIVLLNPEKDLEERDVNLLTSYWENDSGSLLVFLNPQQDTPRLDRMLEKVGVARRDDRVLHSINSVVDARPEYRVQGRYLGGSRITDSGLADTVTTFNGVTCSLDIAVGDQALAQEGIVPVALIAATDRFWGESQYDTGLLPVFDPSEDHGQPVYVAAAVERGGVADSPVRLDSSRMVVVANGTLLDPDTASNSNVDFVLSSLNWVLDREQLIGITPKRATTYSITMDAGQTKRTFWLVVLILPGLVFGTAVLMWSIRRA